MSAPLVVLSIATILGGGIDFPFWNFDFLTRFLAPLFPTAEVVTLSAGTKWALALGTLALALIGLGFGLKVWETADHPALEPNFLRRMWYFDDIVSATVSGPLTRAATFLAVVLDGEVIDGIVNALAGSFGASGRILRKAQDGYLRTYLLGIGVGVVIVLAYLSFRIAI
jgi:NADH-quinone oxidoreductase subunit L